MGNVYGTILSIAFLVISIRCCTNGGDSNTTNHPATVGEALRTSDKNGTFPSLNRDNTVAGPDMDNNGVRDDIDAFINSLPDTLSQKAALRQISSAIRNAMLFDTTDQNALVAASNKISNGSACIHSTYDSSNASSRNLEIEKLTVNTKVRFIAYERFSRSIRGTSFVLPEGNGCDK